MGFIDLVKARARADKKTIVLPESMDRRTWEAAETILKEDIANLIIIGTPEDIADHSKGLDVSGATVINPQTYEKTQEYIDLFVELRKSKGMTPEKAKEIIMSDYAYYGCLMIKTETRRIGFRRLPLHGRHIKAMPADCQDKTRHKTGIRILPHGSSGLRVRSRWNLIFADSGLNQNPNPEELAAIAKSSADSFELLVQKEARVAMLSHSTKGSAKHPDVDKVVEATRIAKELYPELKLDGELQLDAALVPEVCFPPKAPGSEVAGKANVLMFPDLDAGNIGYKLVQRLAKAEAYGPVTQGIAKPVNDLSRGCCADDIVGVVAITAVQAQAE